MHHDPKIHRRRSIRLTGYDYSAEGSYLVTIVTKDRECFFGEVVNEEMMLNEAGKIVEQCWLAIPRHFPNVTLDDFVVMPNHVHGIVKFGSIVTVTEHTVGMNNVPVGAKDISPLRKHIISRIDQSPWDFNNTTPFRSPSKTVGSVVRGFKIGVTKWFREHTDVHVVWQRNYYEHIIRDEDDLQRIRDYIVNNPIQWFLDDEHAINRY